MVSLSGTLLLASALLPVLPDEGTAGEVHGAKGRCCMTRNDIVLGEVKASLKSNLQPGPLCREDGVHRIRTGRFFKSIST